MQHALLAIAIALILAIAAALAAPAYVNWNDWRAQVESYATVLAGAPVHIRGTIDATILPTPAFTLRDVAVGDPEAGNGVRVGEVRGVLSLGALLRGMVEAEEFVLSRPAMRLVVETDRPILASLGAAARAAGPVALARFVMERGSLIIDDRATGRVTTVDEISAAGEIRAHDGPVKIEASLRHGGGRWSLKANAGQFKADGNGRVRLTLERADDGALFDADGMLALGGTAPRFEGKLVAAQRKGSGLPWQISTTAKASEQKVAFEGFELTLGADAAPTDLAGQVEFVPERGGRIDGTLTARRIDLDTALGSESVKATPAALLAARDVLALLNELPFRGRIGVSVEALVAGGGSVRELKADLGLRSNALAIERFEAKLPGRGLIKANGTEAGSATFSGDAVLEAEDAAAFMRWAFGGTAAAAFNESGALRVAGQADWTGGRIAVDELDFVLGETKLGGKFMIAPGEGTRRTRIETALTANGADLDLLAPIADWMRTGAEASDLVLGLQGRSLKLFGRPLARIDAAVSRTSEAVAVDRLVVEDFDGLTVRASGRISAPIERPSGKIDFNLVTTRPDGLAVIATELLGDDAGELVRRIAAPGRALKLSGAAVGAGSAAGVEVTANGTLGEMQASLAAHFDLLTESLSEAHVSLDARDPSKLTTLFGLSPGLPSAGGARLEMDFAAPGEAGMPVSARLSVPGTTLSAEGAFRFGEGERIEPRLDLRIEASDLRPAFAAAAQAGGEGPIAAEGTLRLARTAEAFAFEAISLKIGGAQVKGALSASGLDKPVIDGKLAIERLELAGLLGLSLGHARDSPSFWPAVRLNPALLAAAMGMVEFEVARLGLSGALPATAAKFKLKLSAAETAIEDFSGDFAGGKLAGHARFVRGETLAFDGRATLNSFDVARVVAPATGKGEARGRGDLTLTVAGNGATPAALVASLAGQGTIALQGLEIDRADPAAVAIVFNTPEKNEPKDEIGVIAALAPALAKAPLKIGKIEAPVIVAGGVAHTGKARTSVDAAQIVAEASLDLAKLTLDSAVEIEIASPAGLTVRPGAALRWRGPLAAPERGIEAASLATAITLRAMERETKRIEERDRALPPLPPRAQPELPAEPDPVASVPSLTPPDPAAPAISIAPRAAPPLARPRVVDQPRNTLPPLPPPLEIRPAPQIYPPRMDH